MIAALAALLVVVGLIIYILTRPNTTQNGISAPTPIGSQPTQATLATQGAGDATPAGTSQSAPATSIVETGDGTRVNIDALGLSVELPGSGWTSSPPDDYPDTLSGRLYNGDRSLVFAAFLFNDHGSGGIEGVKEFGEEFAHEFQLIPVGESKQETFQGFQAWRIEGTGMGQQDTFGPDYRFVEYWMDTEEGIMVVLAGAKVAQWESGGAGQVESILRSVRLTR